MGGAETVRLATVIPVFNEAAHIQRCLDGLLEQTIDPSSHMILVLDGGSTDGTQAIVKQTISSARAKEGPRLELLDNPDRTVAHARNLALRVLPSSVELVVELIGHTVVESNHLEQRLEAWEACTALSSAPLGAVGVLVKEMETHSTPTAIHRRGTPVAVGAERWTIQQVYRNRYDRCPCLCNPFPGSIGCSGGMGRQLHHQPRQ